jgi:hypothetical protein
MYKPKKYLLIVMVLFLISGCAIHRKFPFICFKKECVLGQMGFYAAKDSFRRAKINAKVRKHKRMIKRNIKAGRKGKQPPYDIEKENRQRDSLAYTGGFAGVCKEMKVIFVEMPRAIQSETAPVWRKDTVIVKYMFDEKDLSTDEKKAVSELIAKYGATSFGEVLIVNCHSRSVLSEFELLMLSERERNIIRYLKKSGIPPKRISTGD